MPLEPLPPALLTAARLRKQARDLVLEAELLEAEYGVRISPEPVEFMFSKEKRDQRKRAKEKK